MVLCDDNEDVRDGLGLIVETAGFAVLAVSDGSAAYEAVVSFNPPIVISDLDMPGISGEELCRRIRRSNLPRQPYIMAISGRIKTQLPDETSGFNTCLQKPVRSDALLEILEWLFPPGS